MKTCRQRAELQYIQMLAVKLAEKETIFTTICLASWHHKSSFVSEGIFTVISPWEQTVALVVCHFVIESRCS